MVIETVVHFQHRIVRPSVRGQRNVWFHLVLNLGAQLVRTDAHTIGCLDARLQRNSDGIFMREPIVELGGIDYVVSPFGAIIVGSRFVAGKLVGFDGSAVIGFAVEKMCSLK